MSFELLFSFSWHCSFKPGGENNRTTPWFCALVCFVCHVCSWLSSLLANIHVAFQRPVYHFVDVIIMAVLPRMTIAVTVTTRKCSPTHFSDKKLPGILRLPMVCWLDRNICCKGFKGWLIMCTVFRIVIFPQNSLKLWKPLWKMIREVAKIHKQKAKLRAVLFIILVKRKREGWFFFPVSQWNQDSKAQQPHLFMKLWAASFKGEAQLQ